MLSRVKMSGGHILLQPQQQQELLASLLVQVGTLPSGALLCTVCAAIASLLEWHTPNPCHCLLQDHANTSRSLSLPIFLELSGSLADTLSETCTSAESGNVQIATLVNDSLQMVQLLLAMGTHILGGLGGGQHAAFPEALLGKPPPSPLEAADADVSSWQQYQLAVLNCLNRWATVSGMQGQQGASDRSLTLAGLASSQIWPSLLSAFALQVNNAQGRQILNEEGVEASISLLASVLEGEVEALEQQEQLISSARRSGAAAQPVTTCDAAQINILMRAAAGTFSNITQMQQQQSQQVGLEVARAVAKASSALVRLGSSQVVLALLAHFGTPKYPL